MFHTLGKWPLRSDARAAMTMLVAALDEYDRRQLALALDLLARRLRADGFQPTRTIAAMRETLAATDLSRPGPTKRDSAGEQPDHGPVMYDYDECAHRLRVSRRTIERAANSGELRTTTFGRAVR